MKRIFFAVLLVAAFAQGLHAQYATRFTITSLGNDALKTKIEKALSALFTELNDACVNNRKPKFDKETMSKAAIDDVEKIWRSSPFRSIESELVEPGIKTHLGWQVHKITVHMARASEENNFEELEVDFSGNGIIERVNISFHQYQELLDGANSVTDMRRRQVILSFLEDFRTAYWRKDLPFLEEVYSDNALIITGRKVERKKVNADVSYGNLQTDDIVLVKQNKQQYLAALARVFKNNAYINLTFDEIIITKDPKHTDVYGVELRQDWNSTTYSDVGYLFLMIDFKDELKPEIQVRTWTPDRRFGLRDFPIERPE